jgi:alpha-D-glucose phosphate-specific phosphoglucomutase
MASGTAVKFGTDGWRGVIADDFTFENVRAAANAIAYYVLAEEDAQRGLAIGFDTRFGSAAFARAVADVIAQSGIPVLLADRVTPTPALSYAVRSLGCAGGVMITSSHNPYNWNGVKYKASYGGSGKPSIMSAIESHLGKPTVHAAQSGTIQKHNFVPEYVSALREFADLDAISRSGFKFGIDCMYGAGAGVLAGIFEGIGTDFVEIRANADPLFPDINPEPIEPHLRALQNIVIAEKCHAGFVTDGDADRIGAVDEHGKIVTSHTIFAVLLRWLIERKKWPGEVVRAFNTTKMLDQICAKHGRKLHEVGIGFKYVTDLMLERDILIGGEESGGIGITRHLPERDGLLNALLLATVMAEEKRTLAELVSDLEREYGEHHYDRIDLHIADDIKNDAIRRARAGVEAFAGMRISRMETLDGVKFYLENAAAKKIRNAAETWLLFRASGTEPLLRIYSESCTADSVARLLEAGRAFTLNGSL